MYESYYDTIVNTIANNEELLELLNDALYKISYDLQNKLNTNIITFHNSISDKIILTQKSRIVILSICKHKYIIKKDKIIKNYLKIVFNKSSEKSPLDLMTKCILEEIISQTNIFAI